MLWHKSSRYIYQLFSPAGYDLGQVNMYINKMFENIGSLIYEEAEDNDKCNFLITGVHSVLGEKLDFQQVRVLMWFVICSSHLSYVREQ